MAHRRQVIEILAPTVGLKSDSPSTIMDVRSQPAGNNAKLYYGANQKEYGSSLFITGSGSILGAPVNGLFEATFANGSVIQAFTHTGVYKYTSAGDTLVSDGQIFTGTFSDYWAGAQHIDRFYYSNGINPIQYKDSVAATGTDMAGAIAPTTYSAWALQSLNEHLNLYHTIEGGSEFYKRVRWTQKGVLTPSATTDFTAGTAGAIDLPDCEGEIKCSIPLGSSMAIYSEHSIHIQYWVGGEEVYKIQKTISGIGTPSRRGACSRGHVNYFFSHNNIYAYYGGTDLRPIGESVKKLIFGNINDTILSTVWLEFDESYNELLVHVPSADATTFSGRTQPSSISS